MVLGAIEWGQAQVRIFKSRWFQRFARKEAITDAVLLEAADRADKGQIDADLGGEVIKQRVAKPGRGGREATGHSFYSGGDPRRSLFTGFPKASGRISMRMN